MNTDRRLRVLYVEDNCDAFEMVKVMLGLSGIEAECSESVADALRRAGAEKFDLYLLDSEFADGNGLSLCRTLRSSGSKVPIVFYSGHAHPEEIKRGMDAGANGYVIKPHSDKLAELIIQLVATQREKSVRSTPLPVLAAPA